MARKGCGKRKFRTRTEAAEALLELPAHSSAGVYKCFKRGCGGAWHVTSRAGGFGGARKKY